ncbi:MAG: NADH:ubiquinone reductase (Na(+)-transporting) subunit C [Bacteroidales bacterium]
MKSFSNTYTFIFSSVMVIIVAALLSVASLTLKPFQDKNIEIEQKLNILKTVGKSGGAENATDKNRFIEQEYNKYITDSYVVNSKGEKVQGITAFNIDLKEELDKPTEKQNLPVFVFTDDDGAHKFIFPVRGKGLWGPLWGYVALNDDYNTIFGVTFDHKSETPGLGAEISTIEFQEKFKGKMLFENEKFVSVKVVKGGASPGDLHGVDAISGGTITSIGLQNMLGDCLGNYQNYFKTLKK